MKHSIKQVNKKEVHEIYDFTIDKYLPESWLNSDFNIQVKLLARVLPEDVSDYIYTCDMSSELELEFYVHGGYYQFDVQVIDILDFI